MKRNIAGLAIIALFVVYALFLLLSSQPVETRDVYQYIDHDAQVVCYILENGNGISCLPLDEIREVNNDKTP